MVHYYGTNRPDSLTIYGTNWKVVWFSDMEEMGTCDFETQKITISKKVSAKLAVDILIHEALHAIYWFGALPDKVSEERVISVLSSGLNSLFSANPKLSRWITEVHEEDF